MQSREKRKEYYLKNRDSIIKCQLQKYEELTSIFRNWRSGLKCCVCGEEETVCLDFHHINMEEKEKNVTKMVASGYNSVIKELKKCIVVCANCHRKIHADLISFDVKEDLSESFMEFYNSKES